MASGRLDLFSINSNGRQQKVLAVVCIFNKVLRFSVWREHLLEKQNLLESNMLEVAVSRGIRCQVVVPSSNGPLRAGSWTVIFFVLGIPGLICQQEPETVNDLLKGLAGASHAIRKRS